MRKVRRLAVRASSFTPDPLGGFRLDLHDAQGRLARLGLATVAVGKRGRPIQPMSVELLCVPPLAQAGQPDLRVGLHQEGDVALLGPDQSLLSAADDEVARFGIKKGPGVP